MEHPDCSCCRYYPCERTPDIFQHCWEFELAEGAVPIPPMDWRPDWSGVELTPEKIRELNRAEARFGLPESNSGWEDRANMAWVTSRYEL